jgi:hypothetical protein
LPPLLARTGRTRGRFMRVRSGARLKAGGCHRDSTVNDAKGTRLLND